MDKLVPDERTTLRNVFDSVGMTPGYARLLSRNFGDSMDTPFSQLPDEVKEQVFRRVWEVLAGVDRSGQFDHLSVMDRSAILEILRDTKEDFAGWLAVNGAGSGR